ncbi:hypothetical protein ACERII_17355 [Evansella sp. AB-rgal1]|uniref:hypothetical protein n=1 Tax=Evansella sp. AB-rgal1 TaxID=3242696 RepID=UPI00359EEA03
MAQLVKLNNYISRYESDVYRYSSRFVRLKRDRWNKLQRTWNNQTVEEEHNDQKRSWKQWFLRKKLEVKELDITTHSQTISKQQLREIFLTEMLQFQINWASSSVFEISNVKRKYFHDSLLQTLLKELPDSFFLFYEPVFLSKKAPVELSIVLLTPTELWLISPILGSTKTIFHHDSERFWVKEDGNSETKILSPIISLKRMRTVIEPIFLEKGISIPIRTLVLAKDSYIDIPKSQYKIKLIDKRNWQQWIQTQKSQSIPLKHHQLKTVDVLLANCASVGERRMENIVQSNSIIDD